MSKQLLSIVLVLLPLCSQAAAPQRIISLGSAITETVYALGEGKRLVAVDSTSQYPVAARQLADVGYLRALGAEGLLSLQPDLIIASHEAGPAQILRQMRNAGVTVEIIHTGPGLEQALNAIEQVGVLLGQADAAKQLADRNRQQLQSVAASHASNVRRPRVLFVLGGHGAQPTISGRDTKAASMIALAGGENVATGFSNYQAASPEALLNMQPDVIVAASHGVEQLGGVAALIKNSSLNLTPAGRNRHIVVMDSAYLLGMGPRLGAAVADLSEKIHRSAVVSAGETTP